MRPAEFWDSDPIETIAFIRAYVYRRDQLRRELIRLAWQTAGLHRAKHFPENVAKLLPPDLDEFNRPARRKQFATPHQEWAMWTAIAATANAQHEERKRRGLA
jgi:hypothetical protein